MASQADSFEADLDLPALGAAAGEHGPKGGAAGKHGPVGIVAARQGRLLAVAFRPELTSDSRVHRYFLDIAGS